MRTDSPKPKDSEIRIMLVADYELVQQSLKVLIESSGGMSVVGLMTFNDPVGTLDKDVAPDVAVVYLSNDPRIGVISDLIDLAPNIRPLVISERSDLDSQAAAIRAGAVGIVHKEQSPKLLIEAIRRTYGGETWMNQAILSKILLREKGGRGKSLNDIPVKDPDALTRRELEVTKLIGEGLKNKEIAEKLSITEATVRHHLSSIYGKLGVDDRLNLVILAHQTGLIELSVDHNTNRKNHN